MNLRCFGLLLICTVLYIANAGHASAFYNPRTGRWLSKEPIEEQGGVNLYEYVYDDPVSLIDRDGLQVVAPFAPPVRNPVPRPTPPRPTPSPGGILPPDGLDDFLNPLRVPPPTFSNSDAQDVATRPDRVTLVSHWRHCRGENMFFYSNADPLNRATGTVGVIWGANPSGAASTNPPGCVAAQGFDGQTVAGGHLMPRLFGGEDSYRNITTQESGFNGEIMNQLTSIIPNKELKSSKYCYICLAVMPHYTFTVVPTTAGALQGRSMPAPPGFDIIRVNGKDPQVYYNYVSQPHLDGDYRKEAPPWNTALASGINH